MFWQVCRSRRDRAPYWMTAVFFFFVYLLLFIFLRGRYSGRRRCSCGTSVPPFGLGVCNKRAREREERLEKELIYSFLSGSARLWLSACLVRCNTMLFCFCFFFAFATHGSRANLFSVFPRVRSLSALTFVTPIIPLSFSFKIRFCQCYEVRVWHCPPVVEVNVIVLAVIAPTKHIGRLFFFNVPSRFEWFDDTSD